MCFGKFSLNAAGWAPNLSKGGLTTRFDPPPNGLRELKLHRSSTNVCTKTKMFLNIFLSSGLGVKGHKVGGLKVYIPVAPVWSV